MSSSRRPVYVNKKLVDTGAPLVESRAAEFFHRRLSGYAPTPLVSLPDVAKQLKLKGLYVKDESSRLGLPSFKVLGASWATFHTIARTLGLPLDIEIQDLAIEAAKASLKLFAATDGNHGRAVAFMAKVLSLPACIYVPSTLSEHTKNAISGEGVSVIVGPGDYDSVVQDAFEASRATAGGIFIQDTSFPLYEDIPARIVEGYSTMFREIDEQLTNRAADCDFIFTPVGVGSLAHGVVQHYKSQARQKPTKVVTVEPDTAACLYKSLSAENCSKIKTSYTIMTGLDCGTVSQTAWPDLRSHVDASCTVSDYEVHHALQELEKHGISAGPCGASGFAALRLLAEGLRHTTGIQEDSVVVLLNTEGPRPYDIPYDVTSDDPVVLTRMLAQIESTNPTLSISKRTRETCIADYIEAWLQHRGFESHRSEYTRKVDPGRNRGLYD
ncbi:hypothetical protein JX265_003634 [Neoarthrinium moseri]|uniref:Tryptophan synthase beta chain-like PALP domain-containing protein n=1 Tax=Neoarthrinium moseri TaxID=1658444 RepID=A0A9Q0AT78_9PEZI|nr:hypothetical protein JX265_003634 [Neoarthrinium moseri]